MKTRLIMEENQLLDKAFYANPCLMAISTISDGCYIKVNKCFEEITGFSAAEALGRTSVELSIFDPPTRNKITDLLKRQGLLKNMEVEFKVKGGSLRMGLFSAEIIDINGEKCILSIAKDVTELKKMEKELSKLEKLNLIGQMAAGIGHEVRNPMTCVRGYLQMFTEKEELARYKESFVVMIEELDRANKIISEFLSLSKTKYTTMMKNNMNVIVQTLAPLIIADGMELQANVIFDLGIVSDLDLNEEEIRQLILNLTRNGFESMPEGGVLTIQTCEEETDVVLSIRDQGQGIDPSVLDKLGTPFFTTKERGTGLGLATCYRIAERHFARITVKSSNSGTEIAIRFKK